MDRKQKGFTLIEILVVVTIIGVLAGLVVVLIPKGQKEQVKIQCISNVKDMTDLLTLFAQSKSAYPEYGGADLIIYLVIRGDVENNDDHLRKLFCPGDRNETYEGVGGKDAYAPGKLNLDRPGQWGDKTSYAGRDQKAKDRGCTAKFGVGGTVLVCDDSEDHHFNEGFVVGLSGGGAKFRHKTDDWKRSKEEKVEIGENSQIDELKCLKAD
jgi:prepilin-type N-terminal cleavage/methylation domain-containing protein